VTNTCIGLCTVAANILVFRPNLASTAFRLALHINITLLQVQSTSSTVDLASLQLLQSEPYFSLWLQDTFGIDLAEDLATQAFISKLRTKVCAWEIETVLEIALPY
jgi:hypothetical protein